LLWCGCAPLLAAVAAALFPLPKLLGSLLLALLVALPFCAVLALLFGVSLLLLAEVLRLDVFASAALKLYFVFIKINRVTTA